MFPYMEKRALYDDYGEVIRAEDYMMLNPYDEPAPVMRKRVRDINYICTVIDTANRNQVSKWKKSPCKRRHLHHPRKFRPRSLSRTLM